MRHVEARFKSLCDAMYIASGHKVEEELKDRRKEQAACRNMILKQMHEDGFTYVAIGKTVNKTHSAIINAVNSCDNMLLYPLKGDEDLLEIWKEFQKLIAE